MSFNGSQVVHSQHLRVFLSRCVWKDCNSHNVLAPWFYYWRIAMSQALSHIWPQLPNSNRQSFDQNRMSVISRKWIAAKSHFGESLWNHTNTHTCVCAQREREMLNTVIIISQRGAQILFDKQCRLKSLVKSYSKIIFRVYVFILEQVNLLTDSHSRFLYFVSISISLEHLEWGFLS